MKLLLTVNDKQGLSALRKAPHPDVTVGHLNPHAPSLQVSVAVLLDNFITAASQVSLGPGWTDLGSTGGGVERIGIGGSAPHMFAW